MVFPQSYATAHQFACNKKWQQSLLFSQWRFADFITGEKLSKQELHVNNTVKKLRAKEKENEAVLKKNR